MKTLMLDSIRSGASPGALAHQWRKQMQRLLLIAAALAGLTTASVANRLAVPVIVGGEQDYDACGSSGTVEGLNPHGDGFLAVKAGPGLNFERIDKLYNGMQVYICGEQGDWFAIVYSQTGSWSERCNVSTPWPRTMPYTGPCRSGWVHRRWVGSLAG